MLLYSVQLYILQLVLPVNFESFTAVLNKMYFLRFVAGVVAREQIPAFERVLWRACRGNVFLRYTEIETDLEDPQTVSSYFPYYH